MSSDDKDNKKPEDKKPAPKQVVVTHYGKKKKDADVPPEIVPTEPTHILSSPVETGSEQLFKAQPRASAEKLSQAPEPKAAPESTFFSHASSTDNTSRSQYRSEPNDDSDNNETVSSGGGGALFFSFISLIAVIVLSYYAYSHYQQLKALQQQAKDEQSSVILLTTQAQKTQEQITTLNDKNISDQKTLENLRKLLESENFRLASLSGNIDWTLAQANYLVYMANERLKIAHDVTSAAVGLKTADELLKNLAEPAFLWIREILAKDIAKLKTFPFINRPELWEQLGFIANQFKELHFKNLSLKEAPTKESPSPVEPSSDWQKGLWRSWQELKSLVTITHVQENPIPRALLAQDQAQILRMLQMRLEEAKWALLQGENNIYQKGLQSLSALIWEYFLNDKAQQDLLNQIQQLEQQNVTISLPDISDSVQALSKAMIEVSNKELKPPRETR